MKAPEPKVELDANSISEKEDGDLYVSKARLEPIALAMSDT